MMGQNFEIQILWFLRIFFKFSKRPRAVPLRPIWTIMVAAKLDQSRVLVTKFRQNRLTLKDRSAGQRHTDRQTRLKIMALQVCNRANVFFVKYWHCHLLLKHGNCPHWTDKAYCSAKYHGHILVTLSICGFCTAWFHGLFAELVKLMD